MKVILGLAVVWLLCGIVAAGLVDETRQATMADVKLGPISLVRFLLG